MQISHFRQNVFAVLAAFIWGTTFVAQSIGAELVEPFSFNTSRSVVAFFFLLILCAARRKWGRVEISPFRSLLTGGVCCGTALTIASFFQQKGMETTSSGKAGFITALYIVLVPILSLFLRKKPPAAVWLSVALAVSGLYLLCVRGDFTVTYGDFLVFLCALCFSVQIMVVDYFSVRVDCVELSCIQFLIVSLLSALGALLSGEHPTVENLRLCIHPILYAGIFSSGVAYTLQILAQKDSNPTVVSLLMSLESVFATLSGAVLLQERMSGREMLGCVLMFAAVISAQLPSPGRRDGKVKKTGGESPSLPNWGLKRDTAV